MGVRAAWHSAVVVPDLDDPLDQAIEDVGVPIYLGAEGELAQLNEALVISLGREAKLDTEGVTCSIKDRADTTCHACPLYQHDGSAAAQLCHIGREQERLLTRIAVLHHGERR